MSENTENPQENENSEKAASGENADPLASGESNNENGENTDPLSKFPPEMQDKIKAEIEAYRNAYAEEFATTVADSTKKATEGALNVFTEEGENAANCVVWLARNSTSDAIKLSANKYILDALRRGYVDSPNDPVNDILKGLQNLPTDEHSEHSERNS